ncbi:glycosyltransferase family 39 protein [Chloroflexus sp.]|uniref:glycosyltransferase family 39 protein n=1 Tax=Chloroflexus sp. TaxID=1904827 RepID=UPI00298F1943|nr:glycosyltransferase family 39 protein [Chloroflexus sp.]MDW8403886.1 glycosyltransferase family 39 protein [Chloroflexus sp.]
MLRWLAPLVLLHSLIYVFLAPPWQHYDEPGHFLYAAYIVSGGIDAPDDVAIAREVADSMYRHRFWPPDVRPDLLSPRPPGIPTDQRHHPPLYYVLIAGLIRPLRYLPVEIQLYAGRIASALLMMLTVVAVWRTAQIVAPDEPRVALALAAMVALTPAFVDLMSAVNSDVLMNFAATAAFLGIAILLRDGWRPTGLGLAILGASVAILTKRTAFAIVVPVALALLWGAHRRPIRWWTFVLICGAGLMGVMVSGALLGNDIGHSDLPSLATMLLAYLRLDVAAWIASALEWERSLSWYRVTLVVGHTHFWARLSWGNVAVLAPYSDWIFAGLCFGALAGLARSAVTRPRTRPLWQQRWIWVCVVSVTLAWLVLFGRLHPLPEAGSWVYIPRGRYLYWAMMPTMWLLVFGWQHLWPVRWHTQMLLGLIILFVMFDGAAIITLLSHYW